MKGSDFRIFIQEMYMRQKDECKWYRIPCKYKSDDSYFKKNKYFLKSKFKESNK